MEQSYQYDTPYYFTRNGFEVKLLKEASHIEFEAEELSTSHIFAYKLREEEITSGDRLNSFSNLNEVFSALIHGFNKENFLNTVVTSDAKIVLKVLTKVGGKDKEIPMITVPLVQQNLQTVDIIEKLIDRFDEQSTQSQISQKISIVNILKQITQHQREMENKAEERQMNGQNCNLHSQDGLEIMKEEFKQANAQIEELKRTHQTHLEEINNKLEIFQSELSSVKEQLAKVENDTKDFFNEQFPKLKLEVATISKAVQNLGKPVNEQLEDLRKNGLLQLPQNGSENMDVVNTQVVIENLKADIESLKQSLKLVVDSNNLNPVNSEEKMKGMEDKIQKNQTDLLNLISQANELASTANKDSASTSLNLLLEIVDVKDKIEAINVASQQLENFFQTFREQIKIGDFDERLKRLEKYIGEKLDSITQISDVSEHLIPRFDLEESNFYKRLEKDRGFETTAGYLIFQRSFIGKSPLPRTGKFFFSVSMRVIVEEEGIFAVGVAGQKFEESQLLLKGHYFINPFRKIAFINGNTVEYEGESAKLGDLIQVMLDYDNALIIFMVNHNPVFEGPIVLDYLKEDLYPCVYTQNCRYLKLSFV